MNHTTFAVDIDVNDYVLGDQQTIKAHQITLDTNLEFGQVRRLDAERKDSKKVDLKTNPPPGLLQLLVYQDPGLCLFVSFHYIPLNLKSCFILWYIYDTVNAYLFVLFHFRYPFLPQCQSCSSCCRDSIWWPRPKNWVRSLYGNASNHQCGPHTVRVWHVWCFQQCNDSDYFHFFSCRIHCLPCF